MAQAQVYERGIRSRDDEEVVAAVAIDLSRHW